MTSLSTVERMDGEQRRIRPKENAGTEPSSFVRTEQQGVISGAFIFSQTSPPLEVSNWISADFLPIPQEVRLVQTFGGFALSTTDLRIQVLEDRVEELETEVSRLRTVLEVGEEVVVLRTVSREQAKNEIQELFESGETLYFSDISRRLRIDIPLVVEICNELKEEGLIGVNDVNPI